VRDRTPKALGRRHDPNYLKRTDGFRWRLWLSLGFIVGGLTWVGASALRSGQSIYSKGPMASVHAFFAQRCELCHEKTGNFRHPATDAACQRCHQAPDHQRNIVAKDALACSTCHVEHMGSLNLAHVGDSKCAYCHENLRTDPNIPSEYHRKIQTRTMGFNTDHPKFFWQTDKFQKPLTVIFSHEAHLGKKVLFPAPYPGERPDPGARAVQLQCADCHRPLAQSGGQWAYAYPGQQPPNPDLPSAQKFYPDSQSALMLIPTYEQQCSGCHDLKFDPAFSDYLPHPWQLKDIGDSMLRQLTSYDKQHRDEFVEPLQRKMVEAVAVPHVKTDSELVMKRFWQDARLIKAKCGYCHKFNDDATDVPEVTKLDLKAPEMEHAIFSHKAHFELRCESCHSSASSSGKSSDVLLPGIEICQNCHNGHPATVGKAENSCFLCHQYHKWKDRRGVTTNSIEQITGIVGGNPK